MQFNISNPFARSYSVAELNLIRFLGKTSIFKYLNKNQLHALAGRLQVRMYSKEEVVFFRNDPSLAVYVIKAGKVGLAFDRQDEWEYIQSFQEGECFGESSVLANTKRALSAVSLSSDTELFVWPQESLFELFEQDKGLKLQVVENLCKVQHESEHRIFNHYRRTSGFFDIGSMLQ
jgi:CRP-like cAMP-binding protein